MLYLDSNATTQIDPRVVEAMLPYLTTYYANPSSSHREARLVKKAVERAREQVAALIDAEPDEIIFTSGGTESANAAIFSALTLHHPSRIHFVTPKTEHSAVLEPANRWVQEGSPVTFIDVDRMGRLHPEGLHQCVRSGQTALVSVMWANNETGVISPMEDAVQFCHEHGAIFHTDAVQAVGKLPISMKRLPVDYLSLSGHKIHAPKGIGALFISRRARFKPWMLGGGQESGRRSGTENVSHIVALGKAAELMRESLEMAEMDRIAAMRDAFEDAILSELPDTMRVGDAKHRLATTSCLIFPGVEAAGLTILLDEKGLACSAGSACHTGQLHPSHVLEAMGYDAEVARCMIRFSFSRLNTESEVTQAATLVKECVLKMRSLNVPGWVR
jgi:cysteine desulfurase